MNDQIANDNIQIAANAAKDLYRCAGSNPPSSGIEDLVFGLSNNWLSICIQKLKDQRVKSAVLPAIDYLINVPLISGSATSFRLTSQAKPGSSIIEGLIDFLALMGDERAIPALSRIANTHRTIPIAVPGDEWEMVTNDHEREKAEWGIKVIRVIQERGYDTCNSCKGTGKITCDSCKGSGQIQTIKVTRVFGIKRELREVQTCYQCQGQKTRVCYFCNGFGNMIPKL